MASLNQTKTTETTTQKQECKLQERNPETEKAKGGKHWHAEEELQYFSGTIKYFLQNSHYTLSWTQWKPRGFYPYLQDHMHSVFKRKIKNGRQIKTKDQNLKKKYFSASSKRIDLLDISYQKIFDYVKIAKSFTQAGKEQAFQMTERMQRYQNLLELCEEHKKKVLQPKVYEEEVQKLLNLSKSPAFKAKIRLIQLELSDNTSYESDESRTARFEMMQQMEFE